MSQNLDENYKLAYGKKAGFGKRPALVLVDFAHAYFDPESPLYAGVDDALATRMGQPERRALLRPQFAA